MNDIYSDEMLESLAIEANRKLKEQSQDIHESKENAYNSYNLDNIQEEESKEYDDLYTVDYEEEIEIDDVNELFKGGPTDVQVGIWKKTYPDCLVFAAEISGEMFIARSITRLEYKKLISLPVDQLQREEIICSTCVLFPFNIDWQEVNGLRAGIPSSLAGVIMEHSGFSNEYSVQVL